MEISIKMHDIEMSIKRDYDDVTITEMFESFNALLIGVTFTQEQINNHIKELAEEI